MCRPVYEPNCHEVEVSRLPCQPMRSKGLIHMMAASRRPAQLPFISFSTGHHLICRHGLLRSFSFRSPCLFDTRCWPDYTSTRRTQC